MKKKLTILALSTLLGAPAFAQEMGSPPPSSAPSLYNNSVNRIRFGIYLAPTISWMHPTASKSDDGNFSVESNGSRVGFMYGLMAEYFFAPNYGLVSGIQVNSTGGKITASNVNANPATGDVKKAVFDYRLQYLEIPLALKFRTDPISNFRFFAQFGLTAGANIGKKATYTVTSYDTAGREAAATGDKVKLSNSLSIAPVLLSMNIGAGLEYPINNKLSLYFGLFFNNGFAPDATNPAQFDHDKLGYKNDFKDGNTRLNNFAFRFGLFF